MAHTPGPPHEEPTDKDFLQAHIEALQAESDRRLGLLKRWNDNRVWNGHRCPFCLESPVVSRYVDEHHIEHEDAHADGCELAEELRLR